MRRNSAISTRNSRGSSIAHRPGRTRTWIATAVVPSAMPSRHPSSRSANPFRTRTAARMPTTVGIRRRCPRPTPAADAPAHTVYFVNGILQVMDSCLRLYAHPELLKVTEAINGADFAPFGDSIWIKEPGLGTSVAWHQDGTTHWDHPRWDEGIHGFNFMAQLCPTTPEKCLVGGSRQPQARQDRHQGASRSQRQRPFARRRAHAVRARRTWRSATVRRSTVPSPTPRRTAGCPSFSASTAWTRCAMSRSGVRTADTVVYDDARIHQRSRVIQVAIDARAQRFPDEVPYRYMPFVRRRGRQPLERGHAADGPQGLQPAESRDLATLPVAPRLSVEHRRVVAVAGDQLVVSADLDHPPILDDDDQVGHAHR